MTFEFSISLPAFSLFFRFFLCATLTTFAAQAQEYNIDFPSPSTHAANKNALLNRQMTKVSRITMKVMS